MSACINWPGAKLTNGYGVRYWEGKTRLAHRVALAVHLNKPVEQLGNVLHSCDNPSCINPNHLSEGTQAVNCQARSVRARRGEKLKLLPEQVLTIRGLDPGKRGRTTMAKVIGATYGVDESTIRNIWYGKYWGHI